MQSSLNRLPLTFLENDVSRRDFPGAVLRRKPPMLMTLADVVTADHRTVKALELQLAVLYATPGEAA